MELRLLINFRLLVNF